MNKLRNTTLKSSTSQNNRNSSKLIPYYLVEKLKHLNIHSLHELRDIGHIKVFQWLKHSYRSLNFHTLTDLYKLENNLDSELSIEQKNTLIKMYKSALPSYPPLPPSTINHYMNIALENASHAQNNNEIPVGAVIVKDKISSAAEASDFIIIGSGFNQTLNHADITAHAEIVAIKAANKYLQTHRLNDCDLYVTIEPCLMCLGAILHSRIRRIIFGAIEPKTGAIISQYNILNNLELNHQTEAIGPINNKAYSQLLKDFMHKKRSSKTSLVI